MTDEFISLCDEFTPSYYTLTLPDGQKISLSTLFDLRLSHRQCEAIEHIVRAGKKNGESYLQALYSAKRSLELEIQNTLHECVRM